MEYARLQLYIPDKFGNQKKFAIFERHQFWTSAAFILILYTAWTLYRIKRPSVSLMESIIIQRMEDAYNEIIKEKKGTDKDLIKSSRFSTITKRNEEPIVKKLYREKDSLDSTILHSLEEEVRRIEVADLLMNANDKRHIEEVTVMYEINHNDITNTDTSSEYSSDSSNDSCTDNDRNTVHHLTEDENDQAVDDREEFEKYSDTDDIPQTDE